MISFSLPIICINLKSIAYKMNNLPGNVNNRNAILLYSIIIKFIQFSLI